MAIGIPQAFEKFSAKAVLSTDSNGVSHLQIGAAVSASVGSWLYLILTQLDGPTENAMLATDLGLCHVADESVFGEHLLFSVGSDVYGNGSLGASPLGARPDFVLRFPGEDVHSNLATTWGALEYDHQGRMIIYPWASNEAIPVWSNSQDNGLLQQSIAVPTKDALLWNSVSESAERIRIWTPSGGTKDFLSDGFDLSKAYGDVGTDGRDIVWLRGVGRTQPGADFDSVEVQTAEYTTTPSALLPRRLRSEPWHHIGGSGFQVNCGYAMRSTNTEIRIIRLVDGVAWSLPIGPAGGGTLSWASPVGLTCDEAVVGAFEAGTSNWTLARIRLDSLGPGLAPD